MFKALFNKKRPTKEAETPSANSELALRAENQRLQLALEEAQARIQRLEADLARQQRNAGAEREQAAQARYQALLSELAAPAAQFLLQLHLAEVQGKEVAGRDVLAVARTLLRALNNIGLQASGEVGSTLPYDPEQHSPLESGVSIAPGQQVLLRMPGILYQGRALRKAGVSLPPEGA